MRIQTLGLSSWRIIAGTLLLVLICVRVLSANLPVNVVNVVLNKTLTPTRVDVWERQKAFHWIGELLALNQHETGMEIETTAMIPAMLQGLSYYRNGDLKTAAAWFTLSAKAVPYPQQQKAMIILPDAQIDANGSLVLKGNSNWWQVRADSSQGANIRRLSDGSAIFSCANQDGAFVWGRPMALPYHHTAVLQAKTAIGTTLIFEMVVDGKISRYLIHPGIGEMERFEIPFQGEELDYIYILIRENEHIIGTSPCHVEVESVTFLLDEGVQ